MDLALSDEQMAVREAFHSSLSKSDVLARVRSAGSGIDSELWKTLCQMGAPGIAVAADHGGEGADLLDAALVSEQLGRHIAPVPFVDASVCARLLSTFGRTKTARQVIAGDVIAAVALRPAVDGCWQLVPNGSIANVVIGLAGDSLMCTEQDSSDRALPNLADLAVADCPVKGSSAHILARGEDASATYERLRDEWRTLSAAALVGIAGGGLELGVRYVTERQQFGVTLATFQSIAHRLADCATAVDGARLLYQEAAWALDSDASDASTLAAMAFYFAAQTAEQTCGASLHFHGGYGFMLEYDIQLYFRRAKAWSLAHGDRDQILDTIADRFDSLAEVV